MDSPKQTTGSILMIQPHNFGYNPQTAVNNAFQSVPDADQIENIRTKAVEEFMRFSALLSEKGIDVHIFQDDEFPVKPDAIFPNNWISMHADGTVITYPMYSENRRLERREDIIGYLSKYFEVKKHVRFEEAEQQGRILEGTGSVVFDHLYKVAYACLSDRTHEDLFLELCSTIDYQGVSFTAKDQNQIPIYHTNVMMAIGTDLAVVCFDSIPDSDERSLLRHSLELTGRTLVEISLEQMALFAGNMLEVGSLERYLVMSSTAFQSLSQGQIKLIEKVITILPVAIPTIEKYGGGSVRCMMAEIFLPSKL
jgi:hypothetical protein